MYTCISFLIVVCSLGQAVYAQSETDWLMPYKRSPKLSSKGILFTPNYKGSSPGPDSVNLSSSLLLAPSVTFGTTGNDLKILVDGRTGDQSINTLILYLYGLDKVTLSYDSATIKYEFRSSPENHTDYGFTIYAPEGLLNKTKDSLFITLTEDVLRASHFRYWSVIMPGYTTGSADNVTISSGALLSFRVSNRGSKVDPSWLAPYTSNRTSHISGVEMDMRYTYYYDPGPLTGTYQLSRAGVYDSARYSTDWGYIGASWEAVSPLAYPYNQFSFQLRGLDTTTLHADTLLVSHGYAEGGQFHYDWSYSLMALDVSLERSEDAFSITLSPEALKQATISFFDHQAPVHRWGSSYGFRLTQGAGFAIHAFNPRSSAHLSSQKDQTMFPNPCTERLAVSDPTAGPWVVTSVLGDNWSLQQTDQGVLDVSTIPAGIYLLRGHHGAIGKFAKIQR
jgi:hypothetical protein